MIRDFKSSQPFIKSVVINAYSIKPETDSRFIKIIQKVNVKKKNLPIRNSYAFEGCPNENLKLLGGLHEFALHACLHFPIRECSLYFISQVTNFDKDLSDYVCDLFENYK